MHYLLSCNQGAICLWDASCHFDDCETVIHWPTSSLACPCMEYRLSTIKCSRNNLPLCYRILSLQQQHELCPDYGERQASATIVSLLLACSNWMKTAVICQRLRLTCKNPWQKPTQKPIMCHRHVAYQGSINGLTALVLHCCHIVIILPTL